MQNRGDCGFANRRSLQLPRKIGVNYGAGATRIQQKTKGACAIYRRLNDNQISVAQSEFDYFVYLLYLRCKRIGKRNRERQKDTARNQSTPARKTTSFPVTTSIWKKAGRLNQDFPIGNSFKFHER
jgi:hypothetical protein